MFHVCSFLINKLLKYSPCSQTERKKCNLTHVGILCCFFYNNMFTCLTGSRIKAEEAFYLYSRGPDLTSIMPCKYGKPSGSFSKFVSQEGLKCEHVREILMKNKDIDSTALVVSHSNMFILILGFEKH